jgi:hypothetical protein
LSDVHLRAHALFCIHWTSSLLTPLALSSEAARADAPVVAPAVPATRLVVALRLGVEPAFGRAEQDEVVQDADMARTSPWLLPIGLSVLAQRRSGLELGGGLELAPGISHQLPSVQYDSRPAGHGRALAIRTSAEAAYHFRPAARVDPWLGAGIGAEVLRYTASVGEDCWSNGDCYRTKNVRARYMALPELSVSVGVDFGSDNLRIGLMLRLGTSPFYRVRRSYTMDDPEYGSER